MRGIINKKTVQNEGGGGRAKKAVHFQTTGMKKKSRSSNAKRFRQKVIHTHLKKVHNGQKLKIWV